MKTIQKKNLTYFTVTLLKAGLMVSVLGYFLKK
ncbi:hypothetical protein MTsPCn5_21110 [Croceitalea sp. MTPC5]|nr:hypothetical protein MTsPCn5_21110 [Croceitalea sp. MTPC5]